MANNPYNNKIQLSDGTTLIDLTSDTVTAANLAQGVTAHDASGAPITGTMSGGAVIIEDTTDSHGGTIREITATDVVNLQSGKTVTPTTSSQTVTPDTGYDAFASVTVSAVPSGTAGTPTATKGTVSNHSVSVTPSVTNTTGYITGGTKTGTAVTVSASELVSGSQTITQNDTYNVTNLASVTVNVPSSGGNDFVVTVSEVNGVWTPDKTFAEIQTAYSAGKNICVVSDNGDSPVSGSYDDEEGALYYTVDYYDYNTDKFIAQWYIYDANGVQDDGSVDYINTPTGTISITSNGTHNVTNYASAVVNVSGGGGGTIEVVTGTFTGTTTGASKNTRLQYDGEGQPVAFMIYPSEGMKNPNGTFNTTIQQYATRAFFAARNILPMADTNGSVLTSYKNSADTAESYTQTGTTTQTDNPFTVGVSASNARTVAAVVKGSGGTFLYAYIASTSYGFMANIEYTYVVFFAPVP